MSAQAYRPQAYIDAMLDTLTNEDKGLQAVRWASRVSGICPSLKSSWLGTWGIVVRVSTR
jgi:hypothetical protein